MKTIAFMNLKGGTAKTVSSINTAAILARDHGARVLLIDADSQMNLTEFVSTAVPTSQTAGTLADLLTGGTGIPAETKLENVSILQSCETLMALDVSKAGSGEADPMALADWLDSQTDRYDWCIIDCPPAFSASAMAALIAATGVVIPLKLDAFGIRGMANLFEQIRCMQRVNPELRIEGVLPTLWYNSQQMKEAENNLRGQLESLDYRVFHHIRSSTKVDDMTFAQMPLIYSSPKSGATRDYKIFVRDLVWEGREVYYGV